MYIKPVRVPSECVIFIQFLSALPTHVVQSLYNISEDENTMTAESAEAIPSYICYAFVRILLYIDTFIIV